MATANDLNISQPGIVAFDGIATFSGRTLTAGTNITIINGNGVSGNPTISATGGGNKVAFYAYLSAATQATSGATTVQADTEVFDVGSNYNTATYTFTAPESGNYQFGCSAYFASVDFVLLQFVTNSITVPFNYNATATQQTAQNHSALIHMMAGETCVFQAGSNTGVNIQRAGFLGTGFATFWYGYQVSKD